MSPEKTIEAEIEPEQVRDETIEELLEDGAISEPEASEFETYVDLRQTTAEVDPNHSGLRNILSDKLNQAKSTLSRGILWGKSLKNSVIENYKKKYSMAITDTSAYGTMTNFSVSRLMNDSYVKFTVESPTEKDIPVSLNTNSQEFANLLEYHNATSAEELKNKRIVKNINNSDEMCPEYYLPSNASWIGKLQYKLFGVTSSLKRTFSNICWRNTEDVALEISIATGIFGSILLFVGFSILRTPTGPVGNMILSLLGAMLVAGVTFSMLLLGVIAFDILHSIGKSDYSILSEISSDE